LKRLLLAVVGAVGLALLGTAVWQVVDGDKASDHSILFIVGAVLLIFAVVADRIRRFGIGADGLEVELAEAASAAGAPQTARLLQHSDLDSFAAAYTFVHRELSDPALREVKVYLQDLLVDRAADIARTHKFQPDEVRKLFENGTPMTRVLALGLMKGDPALADFRVVHAAVDRSQTGNEQYHGLQLARARWSTFSAEQKKALLSAMDRNEHIADDPDRRRLADEIRGMDDD
jgi:hypothetical protein